MTESSPAPADPSEHGHDEKADDAVNMNVLTKNMMHLKLKRLQKRRAPFAIQERLILLEYSVCSLLQSILKLQCLMRRIMWEWKTTSDEELTNNYEFHGDCKVSLFDEENYNEDEESLFRHKRLCRIAMWHATAQQHDYTIRQRKFFLWLTRQIIFLLKRHYDWNLLLLVAEVITLPTEETESIMQLGVWDDGLLSPPSWEKLLAAAVAVDKESNACLSCRKEQEKHRAIVMDPFYIDKEILTWVAAWSLF